MKINLTPDQRVALTCRNNVSIPGARRDLPTRMYAKRTVSEIRLLASRAHPFWSLVHIPADDDACWPWAGALDRDGYGYQGRNRTHRIAWELANRQDLLNGRVVMHTCDSPPCCNPKHLVAATNDDNVADRVRKQRSARGQFNGKAILSTAQALRVYWAQGSYAEIANYFEISKSAVADIKTGRNWAWLTGHIPLSSNAFPSRLLNRREGSLSD